MIFPAYNIKLRVKDRTKQSYTIFYTFLRNVRIFSERKDFEIDMVLHIS